MESRTPAVPFKANAACCRHIPKQRHRVTNWAEYDAGLRARGRLTVWYTPEAIAAWRAEPRTGRGGQPRYSSLASNVVLKGRFFRDRPGNRAASTRLGISIVLFGLNYRDGADFPK